MVPDLHSQLSAGKKDRHRERTPKHRQRKNKYVPVFSTCQPRPVRMLPINDFFTDEMCRMFTKILVPVDLRIMPEIEKSVSVAADLGRHYDAAVTLLGVSGPGPNIVAAGPDEFAERIQEYAETKSAQYGFAFLNRHVMSLDPSAELQRKIQAVADEIGADLVIMASHRPGILEYLWPANATSFVAHTTLSVMVIR